MNDDKERSVFPVEEILDFRKRTRNKKGHRRATFEYLVKWEGYPESDNTWEPATQLTGCEESIRQFDEKRRADLCLASQLRVTGNDVLSSIARADSVLDNDTQSVLHHLLVYTKAGQQRRLILDEAMVAAISALHTSGRCPVDKSSKQNHRIGKRTAKRRKKRDNRRAAARRGVQFAALGQTSGGVVDVAP